MNQKSLVKILILITALFIVFSLNRAMASAFIFNKNLSLGNTNNDVKELQTYLNKNGFMLAKSGPGSRGKETNNFGPATKNALTKFQKNNKIFPSIGYFGIITRNFINKKLTPINPEPNKTNLIQTPEIGYIISGSVTGLTFPITIIVNHNEDITIKPGADSNFTLSNKLPNNTIYSIEIKQNYLGQNCYLKNNTGLINNTNISNLQIACGVNLYFNPFTFVHGGGYNSPTSFSCGDNLDYADESYPTISIGSQCWMSKNLNVGSKIDSNNSEPSCHNLSESYINWSCQTNNSLIEKYCYENDNLNCLNSGGLYEWAETLNLPYDCNDATAVDNGDNTYTIDCPISGSYTIDDKTQGICPDGWHVPGINDWQSLARLTQATCEIRCDTGACSCTEAGEKLKATSEQTPIAWDGTDNYNFTLLPAGFRNGDGFFYDRGSYTVFWTSAPSLENPSLGMFTGVRSILKNIKTDRDVRTDGLSVRCIKD